MKILIVSDIHGNYQGMKKIIEDNPEFDYLFLLGDILNSSLNTFNDLVDLLNEYNTKIVAVRGNNDNSNFDLLDFSLQEYFVTIPVDGKLFLLTHGHVYYENSFPNIDYDVYIQGHTHVPKMEIKNNKLYLNPGSITYPRGGSSRSYILYQDGVFYLKELNTNQVITETKY